MNIITAPHPTLSTPASKVEDPGSVAELVAGMTRLLQEAEGLGLAAPQVGESLAVFIVAPPKALPGSASPHPLWVGHEGVGVVFINPRLRVWGAQMGVAEGCLSIPDRLFRVFRSTHAQVEAVGLDGASVRVTATGLGACLLQHEMDHLRGRLLTDVGVEIKGR